MLRSLLSVRPLLALGLLTLAPSLASAEAATLCVYDPAGGNGDIFTMMKDYRTAAAGWGVEFDLKPYTDEKTAAEDFKAGKCVAAMVTGTRVRQFHKFVGSIEAMGALPTYKALTMVAKNIQKKKAAKLMRSGDYEVAGIFPGGSVYLLVRDRAVDTVEELAGKRIATLDFDKAAKVMVKQIGATLVPADVSTFASMFNNGSVDAAYAPAAAYKALELYKGVGKAGGVIRYPLAQMNLVLISRTKALPADFFQKSRDFAIANFDKAIARVKKGDTDVPKASWIEISDVDKARYDQMFLDVRIQLRDEHKVYNKTMLKLMRRIRCKIDGARAECAQKRE